MLGPIKRSEKIVVIKKGRFIQFLKKGWWEYVERVNCSGIVIVLAMTQDKKVILTEQYRVPVGKNVIEYPAGLVNDKRHQGKESFLMAARRELLEETGYRARRMRIIMQGPASSGSSSEILTFVLAQDIAKLGSGGGDETESIVTHGVSLGRMETWLKRKKRMGCLVDPKIYAGLYFLKQYNK